MELVTSSTFLSLKTQPGFYQSLEGCMYWIFDTVHGRVAVQLSESGPGPKFSYFYPNDRRGVEGHWLGKVVLIAGPTIGVSERGYCGVIKTDRGLPYLKANNPDGRGEYLRILGYRDGKSSDWPRFSHHWRIFTADFEFAFRFFEQIGDLPMMQSYPDNCHELH